MNTNSLILYNIKLLNSSEHSLAQFMKK